MKPVLSPKELALAIGVSESSLKRWTDGGRLRAARTAGGHRRIPIAEAIRFIRDTRAPLVRPDILGLEDVGAAQQDHSASLNESERLYAYVAAGRTREARGLVLALYLGGHSVAAICDGPVQRALNRIEEVWQDESARIFVRHRAIDIFLQALAQLRLAFQPQEEAPLALTGAPPGDSHVLSTFMAAAVLAAQGYHAANLGPDTPLATFRLAVEQQQPRLVWLSLNAAPADPAALRADLERLAEACLSRGASLIVGGRFGVELELPTGVRRSARLTDLEEMARDMGPESAAA